MSGGAGAGRTSIIVVAYNHRHYLADCVAAVEKAGIPPGSARLILVDNNSTDGTAAFVRQQLLAPDGQHTRGGFPVLFIAHHQNLGFAGGNNLALARAIQDDDQFAYLLNPDTEAEPGFLAAALAAAADPSVALVQSLLLRCPERDLVNTWGNALHYLGFGYAAGDGTPLADPAAAPHLRDTHDIAYASGAGVLVRLAALRQIGLFNEELFAYHEDLELSLRARLAGHRVVVAPASRVAHKYAFSRGSHKYYFLERNRFLVLAWHYRLPTLALVAPALAAMEAGLWLFAAKGGFWRQKARAYGYLLDPRHWPQIATTRRQVQALRRRSDRELSAPFTGQVVFPAVSPWLLTAVANPLFAAYWKVARRILRW